MTAPWEIEENYDAVAQAEAEVDRLNAREVIAECEVCGAVRNVQRVDTDPHGQMDICDDCYDEGQRGESR